MGSLGKGYGYYIRRAPHKDGSVRFFSQRSKWDVPAGGHMRFIFTCAEIAQAKLHIADIRVSAKELREAVSEAGRLYGNRLVVAPAKHIYNASDVIEYKKRYAL